MKRIISIILAAVLIAMTFSGCSSTGTTIMSYGNAKISANMYNYWMCRYKAMFLTTYTDLKDTEEVWFTELANGYTYNATLTAVILENVKTTLLCMELCNQYGLELSATQNVSIDTYIDDLIKEYGNGSKSAFNQIASAYGVNDKILRECYAAEEKVSLLYDYFYGENGIHDITDEARDSYYNNNFVNIQHLYINNVYKYVLNEDGTNKTDEETGYYVTEALTADEKAAKDAIIAEIQTALDEGTATYEELYEKYSEDKYYPNGYFLTTQSSFITEVLTAAFTMEVDTVQSITSDYGAHIIKRYALTEKAYADEANADFFGDFETLVGQTMFSAELSSLAANITYDEDAILSYNLADVKPCYNY